MSANYPRFTKQNLPGGTKFPLFSYRLSFVVFFSRDSSGVGNHGANFSKSWLSPIAFFFLYCIERFSMGQPRFV